jgi:hypothetical protein
MTALASENTVWLMQDGNMKSGFIQNLEIIMKFNKNTKMN